MKRGRSSGAFLTGRENGIGRIAEGALGSSLSLVGRQSKQPENSWRTLRPGPFPASRGSSEMDGPKPL